MSSFTTLRRTVPILLVVLAHTATAQDTPASSGLPPRPDLADYLSWSLAHHPALAADGQRALAVREDATRAGALPDLRLAWGEMIVPVETRVGPQRRIFSVSQTLPWFGTLGLRKEAATATADAADAVLSGRRLDVQREVRAAWYRLGSLAEEQVLVAAARDLVADRTAWLRAAYETDGAEYNALLAAEMELGRLTTRHAGLADRVRPLTVALNAAAGGPPGAPSPQANLPEADELAGELPTTDELHRRLQEHQPRLLALHHRQEGRRLAVEAAGRAGKPSFNLGLDYIVTDPARVPGVPDSGQDPIIARVAVQIPLWSGRAGAEQQASAGRLRSAELDLADARLDLAARLENALFAWRDTGRALDLHRDTLLPRVRQTVVVAVAAYEAGERSYGDVLTARRELLALETETVRRRLDRALALNDLAHLLGVPPENLLDGAAVPRKDATP
jgi:outer membrane protein TolC